MKIAVSSTADNLDAKVSPVLGRCAYFILVDTETMDYQAYANPATYASGGAGIQAVQFVIGLGAKAIIAGNVGPNAMEVLRAANVQAYQVDSGTGRQATEAFKRGQITATSQATTAADTGKGTFGAPAGGAGLGRGMGRGRRSGNR